MGEDARMVLALAITGGVFVALLSLLVVVLVRRWWQRREAFASSRGFVLFGICFNDKESQQLRVVRPSMERTTRRWPSRERHPRVAEDDQEPDQCELERWKRMFGGPARSLSTIDEGTEKGTTPITTPALCSPTTSPDRRDARSMTSISVQS
uniref:Uncharacterized protein n=1 Tax=Leersia perrieri TaxID=77586 RepID=A0A0D9V847_9ORYZ